jgi:hypothetical protein
MWALVGVYTDLETAGVPALVLRVLPRIAPQRALC